MTEAEVKERTSQAVEFFKEGYNCAQAVSMAYADRYSIDVTTLKTLSAPFGGGMGRLNEVCGAVTGMFMVLGMEHPVTSSSNDEVGKALKKKNYDSVKRTGLQFKEKMGSYVCRDLLKTERYPKQPESTDPNAELYSKRPCTYCVAVAAETLGLELMAGEEYISK
jgi:C_GCAxxG_C_C family probable redox protein